MSRKAGFLIAALLASQLSGCATTTPTTAMLPDQGRNPAKDELEKALNRFCPLPEDATAAAHTVRGSIVLAAVAGYAHRSIRSYSGVNDAREDARLVVGRLEEASKVLARWSESEADPLFPVYRVDTIIEIADAADAAMRPTLREARGLVLASTADRILRARQILANLIADTLYVKAYEDSCAGLDLTKVEEARASAMARLEYRCDQVAKLADSTLTCHLETPAVARGQIRSAQTETNR